MEVPGRFISVLDLLRCLTNSKFKIRGVFGHMNFGVKHQLVQLSVEDYIVPPSFPLAVELAGKVFT